MRGKVSHSTNGGFPVRITPAYAGKREPVFFGDSVFQDHPRLCGEKLEDILIRRYLEGSPPPMRGKGKSFWRDN